MSLFSRKPGDSGAHPVAGALEREAEALRAELAELQELAQHMSEEEMLLLRAVEVLRPGMSARELGEALCRISLRPLNLVSFFLAIIAWEDKQVVFPYYHEGGRARDNPPMPMKEEGWGLTGHAVRARAPLYVPNFEEARRLGSYLSEAEKETGLIPESWFGVPFGWGERPIGLVCFESYQADAFSASHRRLMEALSQVLALALLSPKGGA